VHSIGSPGMHAAGQPGNVNVATEGSLRSHVNVPVNVNVNVNLNVNVNVNVNVNAHVPFTRASPSAAPRRPG
jgi:hypothetical protein